jgi:hypothetical protein
MAEKKAGSREKNKKMIMLDELLLKEGYRHIPLRSTNFGHLELSVHLNGVETIFLLDTGAASTVIDVEFAKGNDLHLQETFIKGGGVGTSTLDIFQLDEQELNFGDFILSDITIYAVDLSHVRQTLIDKGETVLPCGVIGADILITHKAVIDYSTLRLYLL